MADIEEMLAGLNGPQREAVEEFDHPLLVLAGAGSGKTRVITTKIAYAIRELGIPSFKILAVTFTNKAAGEMQERVLKMVGDAEADSHATVRTFHGFGASMLRRFSDKAGLSPNFSIYDDGDSYDLLKQSFPGQDPKLLRKESRKIGLLKDKGITCQEVRKEGDVLLADCYERYQRALKATGNVDFADLILKSTQLLADPEVADWAHRRYQVVLVDEYQDTNACQFAFLQKLVGPHSFVCVVGDDDQSIYRFRGAEAGNIDAFKRSWPDVRVIKLEQNYRSTPSILNLANSVIKHNHEHDDVKKLWTENKDVAKPQLYYVEDAGKEAELVARMIKQEGDYDHTAVLFRTNAQSGPFEYAFTQPEFRIPYKLVGAMKFYDREQVRDGLALMKLLANSHDVVSFRRMVNKPGRGIGPAALARIEESIQQAGGDCLGGIEDVSGLSKKAQEGVEAFRLVLSDAEALMEEHRLVDALNHLFRASNLYSYYADMDRKEGRTSQEGSRVADFDTLVTQASQYGSDWSAMTEFLQTLALDPTTVGYLDPSAKGGVTLITMHNTKGLEFDHVYVVGLEEGLFPSMMSMDEDPLCTEERRLFYVSVTRARKDLVLCSAARRMRYGQTNPSQPSRFLKEIDPGLVEVHDERAPLYGDDDGLFSSGGWRRGSSLYKHGVGGGWRGMDQLQEKRKRREGITAGTVPLHQGFGPSPKKFQFQVTHDDGAGKTIFHPGERVLSESYGPGTVQQVKSGSGPEVVVVLFDGGKKATFISKYAKLERIAD